MAHTLHTLRHPILLHPGLAVAALLVWILAAPGARGAPLYLSPRLEVLAGATSNRFLDSQAEGSPYLRLAPSLEAVWFGPGDGETGAMLDHRTTRFTRPGFQRQDETSARVSLWQPLPAMELTATALGSVFRDRALPLDDATRVQGALGLRAPATRRLVPGVNARLVYTRFRSRTTADGAAQRDLHWALDPGLRWHVGQAATLWAGATLEGATSNEESDSFRGVGVSAGVDAQWHEAAGGGLWVRWHRRDYDTDAHPQTARRTETPLEASLWGALGLSPWLELTVNAHHLNHRSNSPPDDYREWAVEAGVRLRYDWRVNR